MVYLLLSGTGFVFQTLIADLLVFGVLTCIVGAITYPTLKKTMKFRKIAKEVGGPKSHWLWGDLKTYGFSEKGLYNGVLRCEEFPAMCTFYLSWKPSINVYHPDLNKTALTCTTSKGFSYDMVSAMLLREGLIASKGALWKRNRVLLNTMFHFDVLKKQCLIFNKNCESIFQAFEEIADTQTTFDISECFSQIGYWNMMESVMSQKNETRGGSDFASIVNSASVLIVKRLQNPLYWTDTVYYRTKEGKQYLKLREYIMKESHRIIKERRSVLLALSESDGEAEFTDITDEASGKVFTFTKRRGKPVDFLDLLLQTKDEDGIGLTDDEITDEVLTFFCAGMETVSSTMTWVAYVLANHLEWQTKCREEIQIILRDNEHCEMSDLPKLICLSQCIKETMRLYPTVHSVARSLTQDTVFSHRFNNHKKITLKKGTSIGVNIFVTHRNPHVWENPNMFDPERFSPENISKIPPYSYIPFAPGPRNCIGQHFALNQMKVTLAQILRRYELHWDPKINPPSFSVGLTLRPCGGSLPVLVRRAK